MTNDYPIPDSLRVLHLELLSSESEWLADARANCSKKATAVTTQLFDAVADARRAMRGGQDITAALDLIDECAGRLNAGLGDQVRSRTKQLRR